MRLGRRSRIVVDAEPVVADHATNSNGSATSGEASTTVSQTLDEGDLGIAFVTSRDSSDIPSHTAPEGWEVIRSQGYDADDFANARFSVYELSPGGEVSSHEFTSDGGGLVGGHTIIASVLRITTHDPSAPIDDHGAWDPPGDADIVTTRRKALLISTLSRPTEADNNPPDGMTKIYHESEGGVGLPAIGQTAAEEVIAEPGAVGERSWGATSGRVALVIAIKPPLRRVLRRRFQRR